MLGAEARCADDRALGLGNLACLDDLLVQRITNAPCLSDGDFVSLTRTSKVMRTLCLNEPLLQWRHLEHQKNLQYQVSQSDTPSEHVLPWG